MPDNDNDAAKDNLPQPKEDPVMRDMLERTQYAVLANSRGKGAARETPEQGIDRTSIDRIWAYLQVRAQHEARAGKIAMMPDNERPVFNEAESELLRTLVAASSSKTAGFGVPSSVPKWRATVDEDEQYCFAVAL